MQLTSSLSLVLALLPLITLTNGHAHYADHQYQNSPRQHTEMPVGKRISVEGKHRFLPPGHGDLRGPCPALNAMANHGYLSRDGITSLDEVVTAVQDVFGFEKNFAAAVATRGPLYAGNPKTKEFSIGGAPPPAAGDVGLLRRPAGGLVGTHNFFESDASLLKGDRDISHGDSFGTRVNLFEELLTVAGATNENDVDFADFEFWKKLRLLRLQQSKQENPNFWWGTSDIFIGEAGTYFVPATFSNHTHEHPNGTLPLSLLKSFYGIYDDAQGKAVAKSGWEQIPSNWYAPPTGSILIANFATFVADLISASPDAGQIGGNCGKKDSFVPVDIDQLTGGVYNITSLGTPAGLGCFVSETARWLAPAVLKELYIDTAPAKKILDTFVVSPPSAGCPVIEKLDMALFEIYPGIKPGQFL